MSGGLAKLKEGRKLLAVRQGGYHTEWGWAAPCRWCRWWYSLERLTREHVVRRADGGTGDQENLALACAPCNNERHDRKRPRGPARTPRSIPEPVQCNAGHRPVAEHLGLGFTNNPRVSVTSGGGRS